MDDGRDPLGVTATAAAGAAPAAEGALAPGGMLGRYTLERVLGRGGMGEVWAAHDPDLDRRVAVKVLRSAGPESRARLLREGRAMARLSHRNVITVYEVGSQAGRDYVAMELIDGASLDGWLRGAARAPDEVLRVFVAAGHGLAAAHAVGMVHRDFKPHNVLLGRDGRVVVTDFGLARATDDRPAPAAAEPVLDGAPTGLEETVAPRKVGSWSSTLTATGALVGTPAYMAPEQFRGDPPDPRTDQFAFCVSLWEGLAGERPYRGDTLDALSKAVHGTPPAGHPRIPPRVAAVLRRGLSQAATDRWPSMDALLAALVPPRRRRWVAPAAAAGVAAVAAVALALGRGGGDRARSPRAAESACGDVETASALLWDAAVRASARERLAGRPAAFPVLDRAMTSFRADWRRAYGRVCAAADDPQRVIRIACLEAQRDELADRQTLLAEVPPEVVERMPYADVLPHVAACTAPVPSPPPPRPDSPALRDQVRALERRSVTLEAAGSSEAEWDRLIADAEATGYAPVLATLLLHRAGRTHGRGDVDAAAALYERAARVADEAHMPDLRAAAMIGAAEISEQQADDPERARGALDRAASAVKGAGDLTVQIAQLRALEGGLALREARYDDAITAYEQARDAAEVVGDGRRATRSALALVDALYSRKGPGDLGRALDLARQLARDADPADPSYATVHRYLAEVALHAGAWDEARAADALAMPAGAPAAPIPGARTIHGVVVDAAGAPVAGAVVWGAPALVRGDPTSMISLPTISVAEGSAARAETDAQGRFTIDVPADGAVAAEAGARRAAPRQPVDGVRLELVEPITVTGRVTGVPAHRVEAQVRLLGAGDAVWTIGAPVADDGRFTITGVPPGTIGIGAATEERQARVVITRREATADVEGVEVALPTGAGALDVIVRSERASPIPAAYAFVLAGDHAVRSIEALLERLRSGVVVTLAVTGLPSAVERVDGAPYQRDDTHVVVGDLAAGPVTVCVIPLPADRAGIDLQTLSRHRRELDLRCAHAVVGTDRQAVVVTAPPARRLDADPR